MVSPARAQRSNLSVSPSPSHASLPAIHVRSILTKNKAKASATLSVAPHSLPHVCMHTLIPNQTIQGLLAGCVSFGCPGVTPRSSGIKPFSLNIFEWFAPVKSEIWKNPAVCRSCLRPPLKSQTPLEPSPPLGPAAETKKTPPGLPSSFKNILFIVHK